MPVFQEKIQPIYLAGKRGVVVKHFHVASAKTTFCKLGMSTAVISKTVARECVVCSREKRYFELLADEEAKRLQQFSGQEVSTS